jgi:hypothetical protein
VIESIGYDSERDLENPTGSVFCAHGAGFTVNWDRVEEYMHLEGPWENKVKERDYSNVVERQKEPSLKEKSGADSRNKIEVSIKEEKELEEIFVRTFGPIKQKINPVQGTLGYEKRAAFREKRSEPSVIQQPQRKMETVKEYLLVDGYNIIFSWRS